jgi:hypothetical protein
MSSNQEEGCSKTRLQNYNPVVSILDVPRITTVLSVAPAKLLLLRTLLTQNKFAVKGDTQNRIIGNGDKHKKDTAYPLGEQGCDFFVYSYYLHLLR